MVIWLLARPLLLHRCGIIPMNCFSRDEIVPAVHKAAEFTRLKKGQSDVAAVEKTLSPICSVALLVIFFPFLKVVPFHLSIRAKGRIQLCRDLWSPLAFSVTFPMQFVGQFVGPLLRRPFSSLILFSPACVSLCLLRHVYREA